MQAIVQVAFQDKETLQHYKQGDTFEGEVKRIAEINDALKDALKPIQEKKSK